MTCGRAPRRRARPGPRSSAGKNGSASDARRDALADRELARAVAEALAVEATSGGSPAGTAWTARRARAARRIVASRSTPSGSCTTNTNQPRTSPPASSHGSARPRSATSPASASRYQPATRRARGEHVVEALELGEPERARDVGEAVVEAEPVVVEPAHVGRAALVALGVDPLLVLGRAERDHAALAGRQLLVGVEAEDRRVAAAADRRAVGVDARRAPRRRPRRSAARGARARACRPGSRRCGPAAARAVRPVIAAAAASGSRFSVTGSMSANTGRARS